MYPDDKYSAQLSDEPKHLGPMLSEVLSVSAFLYYCPGFLLSLLVLSGTQSPKAAFTISDR